MERNDCNNMRRTYKEIQDLVKQQLKNDEEYHELNGIFPLKQELDENLQMPEYTKLKE